MIIILQESDSDEKTSERKSFKDRLISLLPFVSRDGDVALGEGLDKQVGNKTECALLGFLKALGMFSSALNILE